MIGLTRAVAGLHNLRFGTRHF